MPVFTRVWSWTSAPLPQPWHSLLLAVVGSGLIALGVHRYTVTREFLSSASRSAGTVVEIRSAGKMYYPVISFADGAGRVHTFESAVRTNPAAHKLGDAVTVLYAPNAPDAARIENSRELWLAAALPGFLGLALELCAALLWVFRRSLFAQYRHRSSDASKGP